MVLLWGPNLISFCLNIFLSKSFLDLNLQMVFLHFLRLQFFIVTGGWVMDGRARVVEKYLVFLKYLKIY